MRRLWLRAEKLMSAGGTPAGEELEHLAMVIDAYEEKHHAIDLPDPIAAIQFRMEQEGLTNKDLVPYIGSSANCRRSFQASVISRSQ